MCQSPERALFIDRMHDGPAQRKEDHTSSLECELVVLAGISVHATEEDLHLELDELILSTVGDPHHESGDVAIRRNDPLLAEHDLRCWSRETREENSSAKCEEQQPGERFRRDDEVREYAVWLDVAVADCAKRLDAEEECAAESPSKPCRILTDDGVRSAGQVSNRKNHVRPQ